MSSLSSEQQRILVAETCSEYQPNEVVMRGFMEAEGASCSFCEHWSNDNDQCLLDIFDSQLTSLDQT